MFIFQLAQLQKKPEELMLQNNVLRLQGQHAQMMAAELKANYSALYAAMNKA